MSVQKLGKRVGLLYDSVSANTGDIAIGIALQQALAARNIGTEIIDPFDYEPDDYSAIIVGGGQLLRDPGDPFYDCFRVQGKHILNSVGVSGTQDFSYVDSYEFISARTKYEAGVLQGYTSKKVEIIPCTTSIMRSEKYQIKGLTREAGEKVVGIHLVPEAITMCPDLIRIINEIPYKKVFIPFTHYNMDKSFMESIPFDKTNAIMLDKLQPLELHSVLAQMDFVIVSSLHATIFSYTQNVPFISMYQKKTYDYLEDRDLEHYIFKNQPELQQLIAELCTNKPDFRKKVLADRTAVNEALDDYAKRIKQSPDKIIPHKHPIRSEVKRLRLMLEQTKTVVGGRDLTMHNLIYNDMRHYDAVIRDLSARLEIKERELLDLSSSSLLAIAIRRYKQSRKKE